MRPRVLISAASAARKITPVSFQSHPWICEACQIRTRQFSSKSPLEQPSEKPYYITTPIFYVNAGTPTRTITSHPNIRCSYLIAPHVGHLYTLVLTDILKRWQQLKGKKAILCTGTDEHGLKVPKSTPITVRNSINRCSRSKKPRREPVSNLNLSAIKALRYLKYVAFQTILYIDIHRFRN